MALILKILKWFFIGVVSLIAVVLSGGWIYQVISESSDLARYPAPGELVAVDDRLLHLYCVGQGSPTVIFELGIGSVAAAWSDIHQQVSLFTRACAYDRAGLGYSEPTDQPLRSSDVAQRFQKLLQAAGIEDELVLVGWSAGGIYIREFFRQHPDQVRAMLFVASSHEQQASRTPQTPGGGAEPELKIARYLAPFGHGRLRGILEQRVDKSSGSDETKSRLKAIYHQSHILHTMWRESESFNLDIDAPRPPSPVGDLPLIVLTPGNQDDSQQENDARNQLQQELTLLSTNGKQIIASDSGHNIYAEQPDLLVKSIEELVLLVREK
jgi:pimeloyl-ACP methyl ester carboxylesterase